jgi:hypothetical protein
MSIKNANLALRFLLELCALAALGYWGFQTGRGPVMSAVLGIGAWLLTAAGRPSLAWVLALAVVINGVLMYVWAQ